LSMSVSALIVPADDSREAIEVAKAKMTRSEAGRKGGLSTKKKYGPDFYSKIGSVGGKKGGQTTKKRYGTEFYQKIGRKGGMK
jgi:general stress protein YciG